MLTYKHQKIRFLSPKCSFFSPSAEAVWLFKLWLSTSLSDPRQKVKRATASPTTGREFPGWAISLFFPTLASTFQQVMDQNSSDAEDDNMPELGDGDEITFFSNVSHKFIRSKTKAKPITNVMDNSDWEIMDAWYKYWVAIELDYIKRWSRSGIFWFRHSAKVFLVLFFFTETKKTEGNQKKIPAGGYFFWCL